MIGLIILLVAGIYLALWIAVVLFSYRRALRKGHSKKKSFAVGGFFFVVMYLIPFWDLIPVLVMHKHYCSTEAGLWLHKNSDEWIANNPSVTTRATLRESEKSVIEYSFGGFKYDVNPGVLYENQRVDEFYHAISKSEESLKDKETNEILAKKIDFLFGSGMASISSGGNLEAWRRFLVFIWFKKRNCGVSDDSHNEPFRKIQNEFYMIGEKQ